MNIDSMINAKKASKQTKNGGANVLVKHLVCNYHSSFLSYFKCQIA